MTSTAQDAAADAARLREAVQAIRRETSRIIVGQDRVLEQMLIALLAGGHVLLEGVPGLAKTLMVRSLARALNLTFSRIQFTPDLMPADITGTNILEEDGGRRRFRFERGPVFGHMVLADEINRATPKTQSALLEAMQECGVTVAGQRYELEDPFMVLATQNPIEMEGTYPLPEAQLDRFLLKVAVTAPDVDELVEVVRRTTGVEPELPRPVVDREALLSFKRLVREVPVATALVRYAAALVHRLHPEPAGARPVEAVTRYVRYGPSPRGAQALVLAAKARALLSGRHHVSHEDIRAVAHAALRHRLLLNFDAEADRVHPDRIVDAALDEVPEVPPEVSELLEE
ncbi:MAG: MoxR family ATPase [Planctomycetes bacterium]|nr:MoxR family ATPase [Planctomycetota bacterium]